MYSEKDLRISEMTLISNSEISLYLSIEECSRATTVHFEDDIP